MKFDDKTNAYSKVMGIIKISTEWVGFYHGE